MFKKAKASKSEEELLAAEKAAADRAALKSCRTYTTANCPPNPWRIDRLPVQRLTDKLAHDNALPVCSDSFDEKTKSAHYVVAVNAHDTKEVSYSYEDICKSFGWDSFSLTRDKMAVKPHWTEPAE